MKTQTLEQIRRYKITAIVRGTPREQMIPLAKALFAGGIRLMEITFDQKSPSGEVDAAVAISGVIREMGERMCVGAGTVMNVDQVQVAREAGARFILSPNADRRVIEETRKLGMVSIPGALTPTEVATAYDMGGDIIKLFPAGYFGLGYLKAITAPLNHIPMMAVGGVDEENIGKFLTTGMCAVGIGSNLVRNDLLEAGEYGAVTELARRYTGAALFRVEGASATGK